MRRRVHGDLFRDTAASAQVVEVAFSAEGLRRSAAWPALSGSRCRLLCLAAAKRSGPAALSRPAPARSRRRRHFLRPRRTDRRSARPAAWLARDHAAAAPGHSRRFRGRQIVIPACRSVAAAGARRPQFSAAADHPAGAGGDLWRNRSACGLEAAFAAATIPIARADLRAAIQAGAIKLKPLLQALAEKAGPGREDGVEPSCRRWCCRSTRARNCSSPRRRKRRSLSLPLLRDLLKDDPPAVIAVFTIRSDNYERLQSRPNWKACARTCSVCRRCRRVPTPR